MKPNPRRNSLSTHLTAVALSALGFLALSACNDSNSNGAPPSVKIPLPTEKTPTTLTKDASAPGIVLDIVSVSGASGPGGSFAIGDTVAITFSVKKASGTLWRLDDFTAGRILLSGPTFNYQRVIPERDDLLTASTYNADGTFTYRFPSPIPGIYAAPLNDSPSIGSADGELTGTALLDGTYTVGMYVYWNFTVDSVA